MKSQELQNSLRRRILAVHGFTGEPFDFAPLYESGQIPADWRFVNLPGHFREFFPVNQPDNWAGFCDQISQIVQEAEEDGVALTGFGYSMGARLLLRAQLECDWPFQRLILIGATGGLENETDREERWLQDVKWSELICSHGVDTFIDKWMQQPIISTQIASKTDERILRKKLLRPEPLAQSMLDFSNGKIPALWKELHRIRVPVALIHGENDVKFRTLHERMAGLLPICSIHEIPDAGHAPQLENPSAFLKVFEALLNTPS